MENQTNKQVEKETNLRRKHTKNEHLQNKDNDNNSIDGYYRVLGF